MSVGGFLIAATNWRTPFLIIGLSGILFAFVFYQFPASGREKKADAKASDRAALTVREIVFEFFYLGLNWRSAVATLVADSFTRFAGFLMFINFGTWLSRQFGLDAAGLATAVFWLGFSDICGSVAVSLLADRVGKRRSVIAGTILGAIFFALMPFWPDQLIWVIVGIFIARAAFEFSIVSYGVLASEQTPEHRGKLLTQRVALSLLSTFMATRFGPQIFEAYGVIGFAWIGALSLAVSCGVALFFVREK